MKWIFLILMSMKEIMCVGDSLTWGTGLDFPLSQSYPVQLLTMNFCRRVENLGVPGSVVNDAIHNCPVDVDDRWLSQFSQKLVIVWIGTNNLYAGVDGNSMAGLQLICSQDRRDAGAKTIVMSPLPRTSPGQDPGFETQRQVARTNLAANWSESADYYYDVGGDPIIGLQGSQDNPIYYQSDKTHGTEALYARVVQGLLVGINTVFSL